MRNRWSLRGCLALAIAGATLLTSIAEAQQPRSSIDRRMRPNGGFWEGSSGSRSSSSSVAGRSQWTGGTMLPGGISSGNIVSRGTLVSPSRVLPGSVVRSTTVQSQPVAVPGQVAMPNQVTSQQTVAPQQLAPGRVYYTYPQNTRYYPGGYMVVPNSGQQSVIICRDGQSPQAVAPQASAAQRSDNPTLVDGQDANRGSAESLASEKAAAEKAID